MSEAIASPEAGFSTTRYTTGAIAFHWLAFLLIVFLGALGLLFEDIPRESRPFWINVHGCVGLIYAALVLARFGWRMTHRPPELPADVGSFARLTSTPVHLLLYLVMLLIPVAGVIAYVWHGRAFDFGLFKIDFGVASTRNIFHPAEDVHVWLAYSLFALGGLHALAALWHYLVSKDGVLQRMIPGLPPRS